MAALWIALILIAHPVEGHRVLNHGKTFESEAACAGSFGQGEAHVLRRWAPLGWTIAHKLCLRLPVSVELYDPGSVA